MTLAARKLGIVDLLLVGSVGGLLLYLFYPTLQEIALICWTDDDYSHGLLLPLVAVYMLWDRKAELVGRLEKSQTLLATAPDSPAAKRERGVFLPQLLLVGGLLLFLLGATSGISYACWIAFFPVTLGVLQLVFGRTAMLLLAPPLLLQFMAKPLPDSVVVRLFWPLQTFAAKISTLSLELLDVPVFLSGNVIEIPEMKLMVEEACSGMRSVMALLTLALVVIYFVPLRWYNRLLLVAASVLIAVVLNVFRVAMTGLLAHFYDPSTATGFFHTFSGLLVFIIGLPLLYYVGVLLTKVDGGKGAG
ncbi:MAG: exosortase/archaeosortase family protein [Bdellovibrionales bacterium]|nr:exosortase/archaeosortase family protein [Bdellovibrionales bacterium]